MINWEQWALTTITTTSPVIFYLWRQKEHARKEQVKRHEENAKKLNKLLDEQEILPQHWHGEKHGTLTVEGIIRRPRNGQ